MTHTDMPRPVETLDIDLGPVRATVATSAGPRILSYSTQQDVNVLASLPNLAIEDADGGPYNFLGGHRLWRSPEIPSITYQNDDAPVAVTEVEGGVELSGNADSDGVTRHISLHQQGEYTVVRHRLVNEGSQNVWTAPWAITQMVLGGTAVLPLPVEATDDFGLQPNSSLVLWPYTDLGAPEISFREDRITIEGTSQASITKVGQPNRRGWMAYVLGSQVFVKWAAVHDDSAVYADLEASTQCYRNEHFVELETLGPLVDLAPGQAATHTEIWQIIEMADRPLDAILNSLPTRPEGMPL